MIKTLNLARNYGRLRAVDGVSFEAEPGSVTGLLGPNGAGKTTLLRLLSGAISPTEGGVSICGADMEENPGFCKSKIGYVPENNPLYEDMETAEYLLWSGSARGLRGAELRDAAGTACARCGLLSALGKPIASLSRGYRQRAGLAAALLHDPEVLLLDEPTAGLDPNQTLEFTKLLRELAETKTVLVSTHMLAEARSLCAGAVIIHNGKIVAQGALESIAGRAEAGQKLLVTIERIKDPEDARVRFYEIDGATQCELSAEWPELSYTISVENGADIRKTVFETAVVNGWKVLELSKEKTPLDEIFRSLTA